MARISDEHISVQREECTWNTLGIILGINLKCIWNALNGNCCKQSEVLIQNSFEKDVPHSGEMGELTAIQLGISLNSIRGRLLQSRLLHEGSISGWIEFFEFQNYSRIKFDYVSDSQSEATIELKAFGKQPNPVKTNKTHFLNFRWTIW